MAFASQLYMASAAACAVIGDKPALYLVLKSTLAASTWVTTYGVDWSC